MGCWGLNKSVSQYCTRVHQGSNSKQAFSSKSDLYVKEKRYSFGYLIWSSVNFIDCFSVWSYIRTCSSPPALWALLVSRECHAGTEEWKPHSRKHTNQPQEVQWSLHWQSSKLFTKWLLCDCLSTLLLHWPTSSVFPHFRIEFYESCADKFLEHTDFFPKFSFQHFHA